TRESLRARFEQEKRGKLLGRKKEGKKKKEGGLTCRCSYKQAHASAQLHEPRTNLLDGATVVLAEVRNGLVVRSQPTKQPHHLDVAPRLAFQSPARLHTVEVAIDVELKQG